MPAPSSTLCSENRSQRTALVHQGTRTSNCCCCAAIPETRSKISILENRSNTLPWAQGDVPRRRLLSSLSNSSLTNPILQGPRVAWCAGTATNILPANLVRSWGSTPQMLPILEVHLIPPPKHPAKMTV